MQISNKPITLQQLGAFRHVDMVETSIRKEKKGDFSFRNCWSTRVFRHNYENQKKEKISNECQFCEWKYLVGVRGEWLDWFWAYRKATVTQMTTRYNQCLLKSISEHTADGLQQLKKTTPGAIPASWEKKTEATIHTGSPKYNIRLEKGCLVWWDLAFAAKFRC